MFRKHPHIMRHDPGLHKTGDTMYGPLILAADPTVALGAATKQYVDNHGGLRVFNVQTYGALPGSSTDSILGFEAAVTAARAAGGGRVYLPGASASYFISRKWSIVDPDGALDIIIEGDNSAGLSQIQPLVGFTDDSLISIGDGSVLMERFAIHGISVRGRDAAGTELVVSGIKTDKVAQWQITECFASSCEIGIELTNNTSVGTIAACSLGSNNVRSLTMDIVSDVRVIGNDLEEGRVGAGGTSNAIHGIRLGTRVVINDNKINNWEGTGIQIDAYGSSANVGTITGNSIEDTGVGIQLAENGGLVCSSNNIYMVRTGGYGILITGDDCHVVSNMIAWDGAVASVEGITTVASTGTIVGNTVRNPGGRGIHLSGARYHLVDANHCYDDRGGSALMTWGIEERGGADFNTFVGNYGHGGTIGSILVTGGSSNSSGNF